MFVYDREKNEIKEEKQYKENILEFLYNNAIGRIILKFIINPVFSEIVGLYNKSIFSKSKITKWIKKYDIHIENYEKKKYKNFNEFFTRKYNEKCIEKIKKKIDEEKYFISPCEGNLTIYKITEDLKLHIKNSVYTLEELVKGEKLEEFENGYCFLYHLTVDCYHRYCDIDNGKEIKKGEIKGKLHTVSSISSRYKIYKENHRKYSIIETDNFGKIVFIKVGALLVGKIKDIDKPKTIKGEEKGYFELGGSTIILLVKKEQVSIDKDIIKYSEKEIPVKVRYMEKIGEKICSKD